MANYIFQTPDEKPSGNHLEFPFFVIYIYKTSHFLNFHKNKTQKHENEI